MRIPPYVLLLAGAFLAGLGCAAEFQPVEDIPKPITVIRQVEVGGEEGRPKVVIQGNSPFDYRISSDRRLQAIVVRIQDATYDANAGKSKEFSRGPVSRIEIVERKALSEAVEVRVYPRSRVPAVGQDPSFNHSREGPRLLISWRVRQESKGYAEIEREATRPLAADRVNPPSPEEGTPRTSTQVSKAASPVLSGASPKEVSKVSSPSKTKTQLLPPSQLVLSRRPEEYTVGPKDVLKVIVFREKELSSEYVIAGDGTINFPLLGRVHVAGQTTSQIEKRIESLLARDYLVNPSLSVRVAEYRSQQVQLLGAVMKPGTYSLKGPTTLLEIISQGGGVDPKEGGSKVVVLRASQGKKGEDQFFTVDLNVLLKGADLTANLALRGNDTVYVPQADFIFLFGQVKQPGPYKIKDRRISLTEAISKAGGLTRLAAPNRTRVIRVEDSKERVIHVRLDDILEGDKAKDILLVAEDIVFVPESFF